MTRHRLVASRFLHLRLDGKGKVKSKRRYFKGDVIEDLNADEAERLLGLGAVVEVGDESPVEADEEAVDEEVVVDLQSDDDESEDVDDEEDTDESVNSTPEQPVKDVEPEANKVADETYEAMSYPDLVKAAKARNLNGGGTKEDLIGRLTEADAER